MQVQRQLEIAGVTLTIDSDGLPWDFEAESRYRAFEATGQEGDIQVEVHWHPLGVENLGEEVFCARDVPGRSPPNWLLYRGERGLWNLQVNASPYPVFRQRVAVLRQDFRRGEVYVELEHRELAVCPYPLGAPLDRVLFVNVVTHGLGVMLHACGIVQEGRGYIFSGPSNSGKTTLARLWAKWSNATILGDECLILRKEGNQFWAYGTPWVGEAGLFSAEGVPVEGIFFNHHAAQNAVTAVPAARAAERLLAQSILTPYDAYAVHFGLDFCLDLVCEVPTHDFGFVPDRRAVQMVQRISGHV